MAIATRFGAPTYYRVYVWEAPVRIFHWVNAAAIAVLAVTGFLIGSPHVIVRSAEAYQQYWFGTLRLLHFAAAYLLLFNFLMRIYWGFTGDEYARWSHWLPWRKHNRREILEVLRVDILQTKDHGEFSSGHNALATLAYLILYAILAAQIFTGFALYADMSESWIPSLFSWVALLFAGDASLRFWHHFLMWFFVVFTLIHVYLVGYHDYVEGRGTISSMVGGWKFARTDRFEPSDRQRVAVEIQKADEGAGAAPESDG